MQRSNRTSLTAGRFTAVTALFLMVCGDLMGPGMAWAHTVDDGKRQKATEHDGRSSTSGVGKDPCAAFLALKRAGIEGATVKSIEIVLRYKRWTTRWSVSARPVCAAVVKGIRETTAAPMRSASGRPELTDNINIVIRHGLRNHRASIPAKFEQATGKLLALGEDCAPPSLYLSAVMEVLLLHIIDGKPVKGDFTELDMQYMRGLGPGGLSVRVDWLRRHLRALPEPKKWSIADSFAYHNLAIPLFRDLLNLKRCKEAEACLHDYWSALRNDHRKVPTGETVADFARDNYEWAKRALAMRCDKN